MLGTRFAGADGAALGRYLQHDLAVQVDRAIAELARGMGLTHSAEDAKTRYGDGTG